MSKNIERWSESIVPRNKSPQPWLIGSGGSWDKTDVQPITDEMLAELAQHYQHAGTPWNCKSMPLQDSDREYMYLLYYAMQGLVSRVRQQDKRINELESLLNQR